MNIHSLEAGATFEHFRTLSRAGLETAHFHRIHAQVITLNGAARARVGVPKTQSRWGGYRNRYGAHTTPEGEARVLLFVLRSSYLRVVAWILCDLS